MKNILKKYLPDDKIIKDLEKDIIEWHEKELKKHAKLCIDYPLIETVWNAWLKSEKGKDCCEFKVLKLTKKQREFLINKLWWAYLAGRDSVELTVRK